MKAYDERAEEGYKAALFREHVQFSSDNTIEKSAFRGILNKLRDLVDDSLFEENFIKWDVGYFEHGGDI